MVQLLSEVTLAILTLAAVLFAFQLVRQKRIGQPSTSSFSTVLLIMLVGWIATEVLSDVTGEILGEIGRIAHFVVMALFAATMTLQLRRSSQM